MSKLNRIDLMFSQALEEDFWEAFEENKIGKFTETYAVKGQGRSIPKLGNDVWPQLNTMITLFCDDDDKEKVKRIVVDMRKKYKTEGIACFFGKAKEF